MNSNNENNALYDEKDNKKNNKYYFATDCNSILEVQECFNKVIKKDFKTESRDVEHIKKKEGSITTSMIENNIHYNTFRLKFEAKFI